MKIVTEHVYPPIPDRNSDWSAVDDDTYDGPGSPIGWGRTEQDAIADLCEKMDLPTPKERAKAAANRAWVEALRASRKAAP